MIVFFLLGRPPERRCRQRLSRALAVHYLYRAFLFPLLLPPRPVPCRSDHGLGRLFNFFNAYLNGRWLFSLAPPRALAWLASPSSSWERRSFFFGLFVHVLADRELRVLRRASGGARGLPRGALFRFLSCPNYFGEIVEWSGFALATWSPSGLIFALWTAANLVPRAIHHHRWYRSNFADYPASRRAVVPFLL
jgi:3-oxo-5-alpha-steroid 4-dehydrogenase 1